MFGKLVWALLYSPQPTAFSIPEMSNERQVTGSTLVASPTYLFGRNQEEAKTVVVEQKKVKKTRLNLQLLGVMVTPKMSVAIISKAGKSESYALEESIQRGVVLKEVHQDYVVISNNGLNEKLQMTQQQNVFAESATPSATKSLNDNQRKKLEEVKQKALKNPISIMRYVRFQPVNKNGKMHSVKVWPQREKKIFTSLGFKPGDELTEINGYSMVEVSQSPKLWQELLKKDYLELVLNRKGQSVPLTVELN
jgi:general secretion pathway protein C